MRVGFRIGRFIGHFRDLFEIAEDLIMDVGYVLYFDVLISVDFNACRE